MSIILSRRSERFDPDALRTEEDEIMYLRHLVAYEQAIRLMAPGCAVLDLGCGEGYGTIHLARRGYHAIGIDVEPDAIEHAVRRRGDAGVEFRAYGGVRIPYPDQSFDAVTSFQVVEHVENDAGFLAEIARVLKSDGIAILTTPNGPMRIEQGERPWNVYHVREYSPRTLEELLQESFGAVELLGVLGSASITAMEQKRIRHIRRVLAMDPLGIRRVLPNAVHQFASNILASLRRPADENRPRAPHDLAEFSIAAEGLERALDLLAVCRAPRRGQ